MEEVKKTYAWQEAVKLSQSLSKLCDEFTRQDNDPLLQRLRESAVAIPVCVAQDLAAERKASTDAVVALAAELELVHKTFPAIDTGSLGQQAEALLARMQSDKFTESEPEPEPEVAEEATEEPVSEPNEPDVPSQAEPQPEPTPTPPLAPEPPRVTDISGNMHAVNLQPAPAPMPAPPPVSSNQEA
ncbi:MAG TPA: hypothetical protein VNA68_00880 [Candidatus Dormibacteraeota bacterium]|nr:hypothetical protein [Candidatus Dormibacteraeota bacterium]